MVLRSERGVVSVGVEVVDEPNFAITDAVFCDLKFDFQCLNCSHQNAECEFRPFTNTDFVFDSHKWKQNVINKVSRDVLQSLYRKCLIVDAERGSGRQSSQDEQAVSRLLDYISQELSWSFYCSANALLIPLDFLSSEADPERVSPSFLQRLGALLRQFMLREYGPRLAVEVAAFHGLQSGVNLWRQLQAVVGIELACSVRFTKLGSLKALLEPTAIEEKLNDWIGYTPDCISIPRSTFLVNKSNCPVLPMLYKQVTQRLMETGAKVIITADDSPHPALNDLESFFSKTKAYLQWLWRSLPPMTDNALARLKYRDVLQLPLQPLKNNLEAETYESFESDPVKYELYERAFRRVIEVLVCRFQHRCLAEPVCLTVAYCGGGRGPLMSRFFAAMRSLDLIEMKGQDSESTGELLRTSVPGLSFRFFIVEKNPNAAETLRSRIASDSDTLWRCVQLVTTDMREWEPSHKIDILISELLGSCGDNELSPECLDMMQRHLAPEGVSIPSSYSSFMEPICSLKNWKAAALDIRNLESHYIVDLFAMLPLSMERALPAFTFVHPNPKLQTMSVDQIRGNKHNDKYTSIEWTASRDGVLHGFAAYFSATLVEGIECSIAPHNHSPHMDSWFPVFVPIQSPFTVRKEEPIRLHFWRRCSGNQVWYEWSTSAPQASLVHNSNGKSMSIGL